MIWAFPLEGTPHVVDVPPQDKAKVEIRKLSSPPQAEAVRDMVRYARNVIEEFRRAKHYKYNLSVSHCRGVVGSWRKRRGEE